MALETATYISQLVETNPTGTDPIASADDHIRLIKQVLKATFPNLTAPLTVTHTQINDVILNRGIPSGFIGMWSGSVASIPAGWLLCNGTLGTPDLRGRFIVGAGDTYAVGATGGSDSVTLTSAQMPTHTHAFSATTGSGGSHSHSGTTDSGGSHQHDIQKSGTGGGSGVQNGPVDGSTLTTNTAGAHTHTFTTSTAVAHTHTVSGTTGSTGSGESHENRPPYYALCYIMKS